MWSTFHNALSRATQSTHPQTKPLKKRARYGPSSFTGSAIGAQNQYNRKYKNNLHQTLSGGQVRSISNGASLQRQQRDERKGRDGAEPHQSQTIPERLTFFDSNTREFAETSRLPLAFFHDLSTLQEKVDRNGNDELAKQSHSSPTPLLEEQMALMKSVRELEEKLARAKASLQNSMRKKTRSERGQTALSSSKSESPAQILSGEDYKNLVDLYFYTHRSRFDPESPDSSPTPTFLEDYAFKLSEDFAPLEAYANFYSEDEGYESPLKEVEKTLKSRQIREISVMREFVDLLLDDYSSNPALFRAYKRLPQPGVAFLPRGTIRLFLQRMSTPWQKNQKSMIRYLSLIDDMQKANLPISRAEWASAVYLAGRSFARVTDAEVTTSFRLWKQMEQEAGVKAHNVTFNILFDIAVRANKYPLAQMVLKEMHDRGLRLNRLGRVSVIYYHGLRGDGDAVRKSYRDFVDAGEIVDTLVLNCVMAALFNAQEPTAAEQIYERMKSLHCETSRETRSDGKAAFYRRYPGPGSDIINRELAANALGRVLLPSARLKDLLPDQHKALQESMPLTPDHTTFRTMISYHANVSGNLNRITVLMNEMSEMFALPFQGIHYQLLFKGFALHGATMDPDATWSVKRLDLVWAACRNAVRDGLASRQRGKSVATPDPTLPSIRVVNDFQLEEDSARHGETGNLQQPKGLKPLGAWNEFVLDLAVFPRERRKHIERVHAELFDEEVVNRQPFLGHTILHSPRTGSPSPHQETYYPLGDRKLDLDEGEYVLPSPILAIDPTSKGGDLELPSLGPSQSPVPTASSTLAESHTSEPATDTPQDVTQPRLDSRPDEDDLHPSSLPDPDLNAEDIAESDGDVPPTPSSHQVHITRPMVCWLLRAYARCSGSRRQVEEVWNSVRKLWHTRDQNDREAVIRVLRRCLRDCDRYGPPL